MKIYDKDILPNETFMNIIVIDNQYNVDKIILTLYNNNNVHLKTNLLKTRILVN